MKIVLAEDPKLRAAHIPAELRLDQRQASFQLRLTVSNRQPQRDHRRFLIIFFIVTNSPLTTDGNMHFDIQICFSSEICMHFFRLHSNNLLLAVLCSYRFICFLFWLASLIFRVFFIWLRIIVKILYAINEWMQRKHTHSSTLSSNRDFQYATIKCELHCSILTVASF